MATDDPTPEYRDIPGFPGYRVGDDGSVWSCLRRVSTHGRDGRIIGSAFVIGDSWKRLNPSISSYRYYVVDLKGRMCFVHRLVLEAFVGPCPPGMEGCHNDGNPLSNARTNLRWDTPRANAADRSLHGTMLNGEANGSSRLTEAEVREIRTKHAAGAMSYRKLGVEYGVSGVTISNVVRRVRWAHVL